MQDPALSYAKTVATLFHILGVIVFAIIAISGSSISLAASFDFADGSLNDLTVCQYDPVAVTVPIAKLHVSEVSKDYERHGFFKIGVLPIALVENAEIEFRSVSDLSNILSLLPLHESESTVARRIEFRKIKIHFFGLPQPCLQSSKARPDKFGNLELCGVSIIDKFGRRTIVTRATLHVADTSPGLVSWISGGQAHELFLFMPFSNKKS